MVISYLVPDIYKGDGEDPPPLHDYEGQKYSMTNRVNKKQLQILDAFLSIKNINFI